MRPLDLHRASGKGGVEGLDDLHARRLGGDLLRRRPGLQVERLERVDVNRVREVDDELAVELVAVPAEDIVDGRVPDGEHDRVAGERVADLTGAHVAGQLFCERLCLLALGPEQRDGMASGKGAGRDAAGHVPGADDGDVHENGPCYGFG